MRKLVLSLIIAVAAVNVSAGTRYIVSTKRPLHSAKIPMVRDAVESQEHEVRQFVNLDTFAAELTDDEVAALRRSPEVRYVEEVVERHLLTDGASAGPVAPNASRYNVEQTIPWGISAIHAPQVWDVARNEKPVNVAILDTGIDATHPDLADNYQGGFNAFSPEAQPIDDNGHGSHVAGTIAAANNDFGVVGVAPNTHVWSIKVLDAFGRGDTEQVEAGLNWVMTQAKIVGGKWIVSLSLGSDFATASEREAFQRVYDAGILAVAAAGNKGLGALQFPGGYPTVVGVGAIDQNEVRAKFSSFGSNMGVAGPGVGVLSTSRVGSINVADIQTDTNILFKAYPLKGSPKREVWAPYVYCGLGNPQDFPAEVAGRIAVIQRGCGPDISPVICNFTFNEKVTNAVNAGAIAAIIFNSPNYDDNLDSWSLIRRDCHDGECNDWQPDLDYPWILATGMTFADGQKLLNANARTVVESYRIEDYTLLNGTSMATPHVSGTAALIWSLAPNASARDIRDAIFRGAKDLGTAGYDPYYGYGMVDAFNAAKIIAPQKFGLPTAPAVPKRRPNT